MDIDQSAEYSQSRVETFIKNFIQDERAYVSNLEKWVDFFLKPLGDATKNARKASSKTSKGASSLCTGTNLQYQSGIISILEAHRNILSDISSDTHPESLVNTFTRHSDLTNCYLAYSQNFNGYLEEISQFQLQSAKVYQKLWQKRRKDRKLELELLDYLLLPFQRILTYPSMIKELSSFVPSTHQNIYQKLKTTIRETSSQIAHFRENAEHAAIVLYVQGKLKGLDSHLPAGLYQPWRVLILKADLNIQTFKKKKVYRIYLFTDVLLWASTTKLNVKGQVPLVQLNIVTGDSLWVDLTDTKDATGRKAVLSSPDVPPSTVRISFDSRKQKEEWLSMLDDLVRQLKAPTASEDKISPLERGSYFKLYGSVSGTTGSSSVTHINRIFLFYIPADANSSFGRLCWCESEVDKRPHNVLTELVSLTDIIPGKRSDIFKSITDAEESRCFSLVAGSKVWAFEATNGPTRELWVRAMDGAIKMVLKAKTEANDSVFSGGILERGSTFLRLTPLPGGEITQERIFLFYVPDPSTKKPGSMFWCAHEHRQERRREHQIALLKVKETRLTRRIEGVDPVILKKFMSSFRRAGQNTRFLRIQTASVVLNLLNETSQLTNAWFGELDETLRAWARRKKTMQESKKEDKAHRSITRWRMNNEPRPIPPSSLSVEDSPRKSAIKATHDAIQELCQGCKFRRYYRQEQAIHSKEIEISYDLQSNSLRWGAESMVLSSIVEIVHGKRQELATASNAPADSCLSIISRTNALHLEAASPLVCQKYIASLHEVMSAQTFVISVNDGDSGAAEMHKRPDNSEEKGNREADDSMFIHRGDYGCEDEATRDAVYGGSETMDKSKMTEYDEYQEGFGDGGENTYTDRLSDTEDTGGSTFMRYYAQARYDYTAVEASELNVHQGQVQVQFEHNKWSSSAQLIVPLTHNCTVNMLLLCRLSKCKIERQGGHCAGSSTTVKRAGSLITVFNV